MAKCTSKVPEGKMRNLGVFVCIFLLRGSAGAAPCVPGLVQTVLLNSTYFLVWSQALNPNNCTLSGYQIDIYDPETDINIQLQTTYNYSDVGFLDMCKTYTFEVHAFTTAAVLGPAVKVDATTAPREDMNLTLVFGNVTVHEGQLYINWSLANSSAAECVSYYRVVYWDESSNPSDVYLGDNSFTLDNLIPCMKYTVQVQALVMNPYLEGPIAEATVTGTPTVPGVPRLLNLTTTASEVDMTWKVPSYDENRCQLTSLVVYTIGAPTNETVVTVPIQDSPARPDVNVTLNNLTPNHVYVSYVALINTAGSSSNVTVSYQT